MDILKAEYNKQIWEKAVEQAIEEAPQTALEPGMLVVHKNEIETVYEIVVKGQTKAKVRLSEKTDNKEEQIRSFPLDELIHINEILGNYWRLKKKFEKQNG